MTFEEIRQAITARLDEFTGIDQDRIDYPNQPVRFVPPDDGLWCRLTIAPGTSFMAGMGDAPCTRTPGLIIIQCFARERTGMKPLTSLVDDLIAHFAYWSNGHLECLAGSMVSVGPSGGWLQVNVQIGFRAG